MIPLTLRDWRAWQPTGTVSRDPRLSTEPRPKGTSVPALLRRRLNIVGRAVCDMLAELDPDGQSIILHASRHGDTERTLEMLYALNEGNDLSPARFGMSVHNAMLGVHSIASNNQRSLQAIAAGGNEVAALFSEARGYFAEGEPEIIAVFSEASVPSRFSDHLDHPVDMAAVVMRLATSDGIPITSRPLDEVGSLRPPQPTDVISWLLSGGNLPSPSQRLMWHLSP
ncbi:beta-ketoacyl synthase chain length factor [Aidingimonas halophila]|uniref:Beta-ketoacyl synthase, N-terminal domain n=1 Tax=Aidingimonas halophila TaxID=574349 RepID=A0A1H2S617_9GAMM|nr:beta-ketoacyl synthase chain length factor [Aidingimonas halophila]GHC18191.1 hypothetical protein GCM10008094_04940 [Aidingimonas halophila]SDW27028.1 Beta-ketoacyl synthase, N-terminal domain [Aidingimonas halophila]